MNCLKLRYRYDASFSDPKLDRDDFGRLELSVETQNQSGTGGFWVQWQDVRELATALSAYPIAKDKPISARWGFDDCEDDNVIIDLLVEPKDALGELIARIELADEHEQWRRVRTAFRTGYPALEMFVRDIGRVMDSEIEEAVLLGH
jgi:hypothetical protein